MSKREIVSALSVIPDKNQNGLYEGNVAFKNVLRRKAAALFNSGASGSNAVLVASPYKQAYLLTDDDSVGRASFTNAPHASGTGYPTNPTGSATAISQQDFSRFRHTGTMTTVPSTALSRVIGTVGAYDTLTVTNLQNWGGNSLLSLTDVPLDYTQIGTVYGHPAYRSSATISTTTGQNYVSFTNSSFYDFSYITPTSNGFWYFRIETGTDAGLYFVQHLDLSNNRIYLRTLNGAAFVAQATASGLLATVGPGRRAYFNEVSIIPLSVGTLETSGRYNPRGTGPWADPYLRDSFVLRATVDKTGSTEAAAGSSQQGSYYLTLRPFTHGEGTLGTATEDYGDLLLGPTGLQTDNAASLTAPFNVNHFAGGSNVVLLDWPSQRVWFGLTTSAGNSSIMCWRYKTGESLREVANYLGNAVHASFLTPALTLAAGDSVVAGDLGSNRWAYMGVHHTSGGNAGLIVIKPDLTTLQYKLADGFPASVVSGVVVDRSRARTFSSVTTTAASATLDDNTGTTFTAADIGRVIKINSGADAGTYKIATITDTNTVTVQTLAGGAVSFVGSVAQTAEIGDRIYLFFNNGTTGAGKINYMESMAPGTFLTRTVTMTNGANCNLRASDRNGQKQQVTVDNATGCVYWNSNDTQHQINKYDPATNAHSLIAINNASLLSPAGGSPANPGTPTLFTSIHANSKFDHLWVGSDQGHFRITKSTFDATSTKRYWSGTAPTYFNPAGIPRNVGSFVSSTAGTYVRNYYELPDGRMMTFIRPNSGSVADAAMYSVASDNWAFRETFTMNTSEETWNGVFDSYGSGFFVNAATSSVNTPRMFIPKVEVTLQWDSANSRWFPMEWVPGGLPNKDTSDTTAPYAKARPIHSTFEDAVFGLKIRWNRQGGATPANNEFLGRSGQTRGTSTDGSTTAASATFGGSGFSAGDVGRRLRIESGSDAGIYRISAFNSASSVTLATLGGAAFSGTSTVGSLTYTVWDAGTVGSSAGPEDFTVLLADGYSKDNTQDITGITYETYSMRTLLHDNDEGRKFTVPNPLAVPGSTETKVYYETYARASPQYEASASHHRALPGAETSLARQLFNWTQQLLLDGTKGTPNLYSSPADNQWTGRDANSAVMGYSYMVDFGADVTVGYVQLRGRAPIAAEQPLGFTLSSHGSIANLYKASGAAPAASSSVRTSGTSNLSVTANTTTATLSSGDFLGAITTGPFTNGAMVAGQSTFAAPAATFVQADRGRALKITAGAGADIGSYRIIAVSVDGSTLTVRNLDQTSKVWSVSASGVTYEVRESVREEDLIAQPTIGAPTHKLVVERLLSPTSCQLRTGPNATLTNVSWQAAVPTWDLVKRVSFSTEAQPPDVANNGTWVSHNGRNLFSILDYRYYMDLSDLPAAQRTGRYWKFTNQPRFAGTTQSAQHYPSTWEFYDQSGNRLNISSYSLLDDARTNADFLSSNVGRIDFVQSAYDAVGGSFNGTADLGGTNGDTVTCNSGGNKFLGFQIGPSRSDGGLPSGTNQLNSAGSSFPAAAIIGRFVRIASGANAGNIYRVATRPSATQVTLTTLSGGAVSWGSTEASIQFTVHEGINVGGAFPDRIRFLADGREFSLLTINDAATTLTISETLQPSRTGVQWEIVRPGFRTASVATEATKFARLISGTRPLQSGDCHDDYAGAFVFFDEDIGTGWQRADGSIAGGSGAFTGTGFTVDDIGRLLFVETGTNKGIYEISAFSSATSVTVKNHYTGAAVSFTADAGPVTYKVVGDRRFRISKYVTVLRQ